ncbi:hypothetical protein [Mycolicibacterium sediminis]|uniref:FUSC family protein n=1 Tax=Mycolicibacterium sediminis TaxID=1286180 RepID=A0A7I7QNJ4_9MYCO|nr:hypothetical protein [Mycolicibacterium sediminis]BBY27933.1 hypothetical protein MSEDJ_20290 [Mycolicibacterium sediminis]
MTDDDNATRPISVAELLAKNGTIGAPPAGGRRRRRRGNTDSVTVAELTGEIPIISAAPEELVQPRRAEPKPVEKPPVEEPAEEPPVDETVDEPVAEEPADETPRPGEADYASVSEAPAPEVTADDEAVVDPIEDYEADELVELDPAVDAEEDYAAHLEQRDADDAPIAFTPPPRRPGAATSTGFTAAGGAEEMSPDPSFDDDEIDADDDIDLDFAEIAGTSKESTTKDPSPSYLRSTGDTLFGGGQSVADDLARRGSRPTPEDIDLGDDEHDDDADDDALVDTVPDAAGEKRGSAFLRGAWVVAQCILAVAFGAGLFIAFDQLWKWNNIVALVLSVLVILGLVVGVRVVRKTEDIGSTLIAVAVGALITLGPLALLQSH